MSNPQTGGCDVCRRWDEGIQPPVIATDPVKHIRLHRCDACGTFWEETERYPAIITPEQAQTILEELPS